jgi:hypothetical protein
MKLLIAAALAWSATASTPTLRGVDVDTALRNYRALLAGQRQLADLPPKQRYDVIELDRWLRSQDGPSGPETKQQCKERLASRTPTRLEEALLDLKCSQRPAP